MTNPIQWFEIAVTDLERAKTFYARVFKLEFQLIEMPESKMYMFGVPGQVGAAGALVQSSEGKPSSDGTIVYFTCEDLAIELERVAPAGGKLSIPKTDIGEFGFFAQCFDTEGNKIGLHSNI